MRIFRTLLFLLAFVYLASPYASLYWLSHTLAGNDPQALTQCVDMPAVQRVYQTSLNHVAGQYAAPLAQHLQQSGAWPPLGALALNGVEALGKTMAEQTISPQWVAQTLQPQRNGLRQDLFTAFTFAFFETPTRFLVRVGRLGENPVHFYLTLQDWRWRVTAIYP